MELSEEQIESLKERLAAMSPEELEDLKKEQGLQQCPFCLMHEGKIPTKTVYADKTVMAVLDIHPATKGHIILFPRLHYATSFAMNEVALNHVFNIMNELGKYLVKIMHAEGVNYFMANGEIAGQHIDHFLIHIIPRYSGDDVQFSWKAKQISEEDMQEIILQFRKFSLKEEAPAQREEAISFEDEERIP
mgnify:CR=1 FL=1